MGQWFASVFQNLFSFLFGWYQWLGNFIVNGIGGFFGQLFTLISDTAKWIVNSLSDTFTGLFNWLGATFKNLIQGLADAISGFFTWLGNVLHMLFQGLIDFINLLFAPLIKFFDGLWYFIVQALTVIVLVLKVLLGLFGVVLGVIGGFFNTIFSFLAWSGSGTSVNAAYAGGFSFFLNAFGQMGGDIFASILAVMIWLMAIYAIFKIVRTN